VLESSIGRQLLVDEPGGLVAAGSVCPVLNELRDDGICRDGAQVRGASRPTCKFADCSARLVVGVREVDGVDSFLPSPNILINRNECAGWHSQFSPCVVKLQSSFKCPLRLWTCMGLWSGGFSTYLRWQIGNSQ